MENLFKQNTDRDLPSVIASHILPALHYSFLSKVVEEPLKMILELEQDADCFSLWNPEAPAVQKLKSYMAKITKEDGDEYIPPKDRIAVFDMDGTLFCETDPTYFDYCLLHYRVTVDPDYRDKASDFEKDVASRIEEVIKTGTLSHGLDIDNGKAISSAFAGFTLEEFADYVHKYRSKPARGYDGMKIGEAFYRPMLQIISYLKKNSFSIYICSGTDRMVVRGIVDGEIPDIIPAQILGTDEVLTASGQGEQDGANYSFDNDDQLVLGGKLLVKNLKMNKVTMIAREIGQQPVLCFGNSPGDLSMAFYVTRDNPFPTAVFMVCCDDLVREKGDEKKAQAMYDLCEENSWTPISMKNDWLTIYGFSVHRKQDL